MANVLIVGCGYVGNALASRLIEQNHQVSALRRRITSHRVSAVDYIIGDVLTHDYASFLNNRDIVYYLASPDTGSKTAYENIYVHGLSRLLEAAAVCPSPPLVVLSSSTSLYEYNDGRWVNEQTLINPSQPKNQCIVQGEHLLQASSVPTVTIRFGGIYGPGRTPFIDRIRQGKNIAINDQRYTNRIHLDDCVGILCHALQLGNTNPLYLATDGNPIAYNTLLFWLSTRLGIALNEASAVDGDSLHSHSRSNKRCSNELLITSGYQFKYPSYLEGYADILSE
jgi:nucleoside-diphosphate-sugar epimerase